MVSVFVVACSLRLPAPPKDHRYIDVYWLVQGPAGWVQGVYSLPSLEEGELIKLYLKPLLLVLSPEFIFEELF